MFKKALAIILSVLLFSTLFSCISGQKQQATDSASGNLNKEELISELENKIAAIQSVYIKSSAEAKAELEKLSKELEKLKSERSTVSATTTDAPVLSIFRYKINEGKAVITGFVGDDERIVIPSIIDGYEVKGVDEKAFDGYKIKSVIISEGVEYIDWFAFYNCSALSSITIPSSIKKIGYAAFDGASDDLTIYCHRDSFAETHAKSYGLSYAFI